MRVLFQDTDLEPVTAIDATAHILKTASTTAKQTNCLSICIYFSILVTFVAFAHSCRIIATLYSHSDALLGCTQPVVKNVK